MKKKSVLSILGGLVIFISCIGLVRGDAVKPWSQSNDSAQRFVALPEYGNEAVLDRTTGLIWERNVTSASIDWETARLGCLGRTHPFTAGPSAGSFGWRLPKFEEIASLFATGNSTPGGLLVVLPSGNLFTGNTGGQFWTASESTDGASARVFGGTIFSADFISKTNPNPNFWCVRGGSN